MLSQNLSLSFSLFLSLSPLLSLLPPERDWPQPRITSQFPEIAQSVQANGHQVVAGRSGMGGEALAMVGKIVNREEGLTLDDRELKGWTTAEATGEATIN